MNIKEFNEKYEIIIESLANTLGGLTTVDLGDRVLPIMDYITLQDDQYNLSYTVVDSETMEELFKVETDNDSVAVERIMEKFGVTDFTEY